MARYNSTVVETFPCSHVKEVVIIGLVICTLQELLEFLLALGATFRSNGSVLEGEGFCQV